MNYIGEDQVVAVRDRGGNVNVLLNSCPHRQTDYDPTARKIANRPLVRQSRGDASA